jgi:hypothetical protein
LVDDDDDDDGDDVGVHEEPDVLERDELERAGECSWETLLLSSSSWF